MLSTGLLTLTTLLFTTVTASVNQTAINLFYECINSVEIIYNTYPYSLGNKLTIERSDHSPINLVGDDSIVLQCLNNYLKGEEMHLSFSESHENTVKVLETQHYMDQDTLSWKRDNYTIPRILASNNIVAGTFHSGNRCDGIITSTFRSAKVGDCKASSATPKSIKLLRQVGKNGSVRRRLKRRRWSSGRGRK